MIDPGRVGVAYSRGERMEPARGRRRNPLERSNGLDVYPGPRLEIASRMEADMRPAMHYSNVCRAQAQHDQDR